MFYLFIDFFRIKLAVHSIFGAMHKLCTSHVKMQLVLLVYCFIFPLNLSCSRMPKYSECSNWKCTKCSTINRRKGLTKCSKCGAAKDKGESQDVLPGDWKCDQCSTNNFAKRKSCYRCNKAHK